MLSCFRIAKAKLRRFDWNEIRKCKDETRTDTKCFRLQLFRLVQYWHCQSGTSTRKEGLNSEACGVWGHKSGEHWVLCQPYISFLGVFCQLLWLSWQQLFLFYFHDILWSILICKKWEKGDCSAKLSKINHAYNLPYGFSFKYFNILLWRIVYSK